MSFSKSFTRTSCTRASRIWSLSDREDWLIATLGPGVAAGVRADLAQPTAVVTTSANMSSRIAQNSFDQLQTHTATPPRHTSHQQRPHHECPARATKRQVLESSQPFPPLYLPRNHQRPIDTYPRGTH